MLVYRKPLNSGKSGTKIWSRLRSDDELHLPDVLRVHVARVEFPHAPQRLRTRSYRVERRPKTFGEDGAGLLKPSASLCGLGDRVPAIDPSVLAHHADHAKDQLQPLGQLVRVQSGEITSPEPSESDAGQIIHLHHILIVIIHSVPTNVNCEPLRPKSVILKKKLTTLSILTMTMMVVKDIYIRRLIFQHRPQTIHTLCVNSDKCNFLHGKALRTLLSCDIETLWTARLQWESGELVRVAKTKTDSRAWFRLDL